MVFGREGNMKIIIIRWFLISILVISAINVVFADKPSPCNSSGYSLTQCFINPQNPDEGNCGSNKCNGTVINGECGKTSAKCKDGLTEWTCHLCNWI